MPRLSLLIIASCFFMASTGWSAPEPATQTLFDHLMVATNDNDHDAFVADCDETMRAALTKDQLTQVNRIVAPRLKAGYEADYLGELKQHGFRVHLWRLHFKDGGDDLLASMSVKDGKVGGFYLH